MSFYRTNSKVQYGPIEYSSPIEGPDLALIAQSRLEIQCSYIKPHSSKTLVSFFNPSPQFQAAYVWQIGKKVSLPLHSKLIVSPCCFNCSEISEFGIAIDFFLHVFLSFSLFCALWERFFNNNYVSRLWDYAETFHLGF